MSSQFFVAVWGRSGAGLAGVIIGEKCSSVLVARPPGCVSAYGLSGFMPYTPERGIRYRFWDPMQPFAVAAVSLAPRLVLGSPRLEDTIVANNDMIADV